jgi:hypothetical protein
MLSGSRLCNTINVVPAKAGTHNPWPFDFGAQVATLCTTTTTGVMGPRLRGDDEEVQFVFFASPSVSMTLRSDSVISTTNFL